MTEIRRALLVLIAGLFLLPATGRSGEWLLRDVNVVPMNGDPLVDIGHLGSISGVVLRGRRHTASSLQKRWQPEP